MDDNNAPTLILTGRARSSTSKKTDFLMLGTSWFLLCAIYIFIPVLSIAQIFQVADLKIDSLKKALPALHDTLIVDGLNELSRLFTDVGKKDSATHYADMAFDEAQQLHYMHGTAVSFICKSRIAKYFDDDFVLSEKLSKASLNWFGKTANKEGLYNAYGDLEFSVFAQSRYDEALGYLQKMYWLAKEKNDQQLMLHVTADFGAVYRSAGNYEKSFEYSRTFQQTALNSNNKIAISSSLFELGELYMHIEDYPSALTSYRQAFQMDDPDITNYRINSGWDIWVKMEYAEIFSHLERFDSAWHYYELYKPNQKNDKNYRVYLVSTGEYYLLQKKYDSALRNFLQGLVLHKKLNDRNEIQRATIFIAQTYLALNNDSAALKYGLDGLGLALQTKTKQNMRNCYKVLYTVYDRYGKEDSANTYFRKYAAIKDTIANDQLKVKIASYGYQQKVELLDREKLLQQQQLKQTAQQRGLLLIGIIAMIFFSFILSRNALLKRKNEAHLREIAENELRLQKLESAKGRAELQQQAAELEMQALLAQMNPHFIFNSLNSINLFILQNNKAQASVHLTKFSRLIRLVLQNSQAPSITLENELETLRLYLGLEAVRFNGHFDFNIGVQDGMDIAAVNVPPLIIQPFVENAIWHGLMHKEEKGQLKIELSQQEDMLYCRISDDGIGRKKASELKSRSAAPHKSMGMQITAKRIGMLQKVTGRKGTITINDLVLPDGTAAGTEVLIKIPIY